MIQFVCLSRLILEGIDAFCILGQVLTVDEGIERYFLSGSTSNED